MVALREMYPIHRRKSAKSAANVRWCGCLLALVVGCAVMAAGLPVWGQGSVPIAGLLDELRIKPRLGERVPLDLAFVDASGRAVRLGDCFAGRPVILHLVYYECPMLCKLSGDGLLRSVEQLSLRPGEDYSIITLSFDPREGPELSARAREMALERIGAAGADGWHFLTGEEPAIAALCDAVGFRYRFDPATREYAHAAGVFVLAADGTISRFLAGIDYGPRDLRLAVVEASAGKVGTAVDQVLLLCYMYDPLTGKYGMTVITAVRVAGIATVVTMATAIAVMLRRERRQPAALPAMQSGTGEQT